MHVYVEPAIDRWRPTSGRMADRAALIDLAKRRAVQLGTAPLRQAHCLIATGHQPWLWHPGILAKDLAANTAARRFNAEPIHLVVDQDSLDEIMIEVPIMKGRNLSAERVVLVSCQPTVPLCCQPPADAGTMYKRLMRFIQRHKAPIPVDLEPLINALEGLPECRTLAEQMTAVVSRLWRPFLPDMPVIFSSELAGLQGFANLVDQMRADPQHCATCYNQAVATWPNAGIAPLLTDPERVELPLWALNWQRARRRVFADVTHGAAPLRMEDGSSLDHNCETLAPRALLLTALFRADYCDLFIHGIGGTVYDQLTDQWIDNWLGRTLAPKTLVSADLHLPFDVPIAHANDMIRAKWWKHHLPHNLDRVLNLKGPQVARKHILLQQMNDDRDRARRAGAFREVHAINMELIHRYPETLSEAQRKMNDTQLGVANRDVAAKRDWCFALYPSEQLHALARRLSSSS